MKIHILLFILLLSPIVYIIGQNHDINKILKELDDTFDNQNKYDQLKEEHLSELKKKVSLTQSLEKQYDINKIIVNEYNTYISDSAIFYAARNVEISKALNKKREEDESQILLARTYARGGLFTQAEELLKSIKVKKLPDDLREKYYSAYARSYEALIDHINNEKYSARYEKKMIAFLDSARQIYSKDKNDIIDYVYIDYWEKKAGHLEHLLTLLPTLNPESQDYAIISTLIGIEYWERGDNLELPIMYLAQASLVNIKSAIKDPIILMNLALLLHETNDSERAYKIAKKALNDANFYNSKHRNKIILETFPIIEETYQNKIIEQRQHLTMYLIIMIVFAIGLLFTCLCVYRQIRIIKKNRKQLKLLNDSLDKANNIKEEYIGYFLKQYSINIEKLEEFKQYVYRKIKAGQTNDLLATMSVSTNTKKEIEELYSNFDMAFLNIYPSFVNEINALLKEEERYKLKSNELNTELRIFALIRLGITDNKHIASFLRYSMQTIYNYRSKVKAKALADNENFEEKIKNIGAIIK